MKKFLQEYINDIYFQYKNLSNLIYSEYPKQFFSTKFIINIFILSAFIERLPIFVITYLVFDSLGYYVPMH